MANRTNKSNKTNKAHRSNRAYMAYFLVVVLAVVVGWFWLGRNPNIASATWWNDQWSYRKALTINHEQVAGDLTDFPVLVSLTDSDLSGKAQDDGDDFVFTLSDGTKLKHEIESFASSTGALVAWVKIPNLSLSNDTSIYMYYGNASVESQQAAAEVWKSDYKGVWHLGESSGSRSDSTANSNTLSDNNTVTASSTSKIGTGAFFDVANTEYLSLSGTTSLSIAGADQALTVSAWVWADSNSDTDYFVSKYDTSANQRQYGLGSASLNQATLLLSSDGSAFSQALAHTDDTINTGAWYHVVGVYNDTDIRVYVNGAFSTNGGNNPLVYTNGMHNGIADFLIGARLDSGSDTGHWDGVIDEVRVSDVDLSAAWIETEYNNQNNPSAFFAVASEEVGPGPVGYWSFDEGYGTVAHDASGQGNDGTISGAVWKGEEECISGKCLYFDGTDDYAIVPDDDSTDFEGDFTYAAWFKFTGGDEAGAGDGWRIVSKQSSANTYHFRIADSSSNVGNGLIEAEMSGLATGPIEVSGSSSVKDNEWHYVSAKRDGTTFSLWIDGVLINSTAVTTGAIRSTGDLSIGSFEDSSDFFEGYIDEVKIYPYARSADQIKQDYNAGLAGVKSNSGVSASFGGTSDKWMSDGLVGYWKFDESATTSGAIDSSGSGNTGTFYGDASTTAGKFGNGGSFDGSGDYISFGDIEDTEGVNALSINSWVYIADDSTGSHGIISKNQNTFGSSWEIRTQWGSEYIEFCVDMGSNHCILSDSQLNKNQWYLISGIYDGESIEMYIDGTKQSDNELATGNIVNWPTSIWVGARYSIGSDVFFTGQIDEVRIYNRALSPSEVKKLYEWAPGPVAHWKFDELSGTTAYDSVASSSTAGGNDGAISGATWARGKYGGALNFDGGDSVLTNNSNKIQNWVNGGNLSASMWFKHNDLSVANQAYFAFRVDSNNNQFIRYYTSSGDIRVCQDINGVADCSTTGNLVTDTDWHHLSWIIEGTSNRIYLDGVYQDTRTLSGSISGMIGIPRVGIGNDGNNSDSFNGFIDDVRIYNYARTQKQILEDMNGGKVNDKAGGELLYLKFDEGRGGTAYDYSVYKNNAALYPVGGDGANDTVAEMWERAGYKGSAIEFDGENDYLNVADNDIFSFGNGSSDSPFSVSVIFKADTITAVGDGSDANFLISKDDYPGDREWSLALNDSTALDFMFWDDSESDGIYTRFDDVQTGQWYHVIATYDGSGENTGQTLYVNGELAEVTRSTVGGTSYTAMEAGGENLGIGAWSDGNYQYDGLIDEVKIWNYVLTADEVAAEYSDNQDYVLGDDAERSNNGTAVSNDNKDYCVPGDTSACDPPVLELSFNEKSGDTAYDASGNGYDGDLGGGTSGYMPEWTRGKYGAGLKFDGTDDYVDAGSNSSVDGLGPLTYEAWIKPAGLGELSDGRIINKDGGGLGFSVFAVASGNALGFTRDYDGSDNLYRKTNDNSIVMNEWQHVAVTWDGTAESDNVLIYVNGYAGAYQTSTDGDGSLVSDAAQNFYIGSQAGDRSFEGLIDEVKIFDYVRTEAQIAWDYNRGQPMAHWSFDECSGGTIHDESGNGNHAQLYLGTGGTTATGTCASSSDSFWYNGRNGKINSSGSFDGGSDYVLLPLANDMTISDETTFSFSGWFKVDSSVATEGIIYGERSYSGAEASMNLLQMNDDDAGGVLTWSQRDTDSTRVDLSYDGNLNDGVWHQFMIVRDDSSCKMYIDGILRVESDSFSFSTFSFDTATLASQYYSGAHNPDFEGLLDEVKIWEYPLTAKQVKTEYNGGAIRFGQ